MEKPDTWIVGDDPQSRRTHGRYLEGVTAHGIHLTLDDRWVQCRVIGRIICRPPDEHRFVPVHMACH